MTGSIVTEFSVEIRPRNLTAVMNESVDEREVRKDTWEKKVWVLCFERSCIFPLKKRKPRCEGPTAMPNLASKLSLNNSRTTWRHAGF